LSTPEPCAISLFLVSSEAMAIAKKPKVLVGMSGGVDSSVSAALLLEQGYDVIGAFMKNWSGDAGGPSCSNAERVGEAFAECGWREERRDAMRVASRLGIPFVTLDFEKEYREKVVEDLFREFQAGRTPNPDVLCNKFIKFDLFVREADRLGCDFIATGHYARIERDSSPSAQNDNCKIRVGFDPNKDQTYFLWAMPPAVLPRVLFPVGGMLKPDVRKKARELKLATAEKKDSMGICFVGEVNMPAFLKARIKEDPGEIVTTDGKVVGTHEGVMFYTIGQRHGLNVGGGAPYYVVGKDTEKKQLIVSSQFHPALHQKELTAASCNWFHYSGQARRRCFFDEAGDESGPRKSNADGLVSNGLQVFRCSTRIRYRQPLAKCQVTVLEDGRAHVVFDEPQRAVTPGQSIVFYDGEEMLGGAIIE